MSITAEPLMPGLGQATLIGAVGGVIVVFTVPLLDRMQIDDVVGAVPVHLFAGIWGTLAVVFTNPGATLVAQLTGIVVIGLFVTATSTGLWFLLKATVGLRVDEEAEINGLDVSELGMESWPEFAKG